MFQFSLGGVELTHSTYLSITLGPIYTTHLWAGDFHMERRNKSNSKIRNKKENITPVTAGIHFKAELGTEGKTFFSVSDLE